MDMVERAVVSHQPRVQCNTTKESFKMTKRLVMVFFAVFLTIMTTGIVDAQPPGPPRPPAPPSWEEYRSTIHEVIRSLEHNRRILAGQAAPDHGGHRAKAIAQIDRALAELRRALPSERRY
jgi:hypothetical protein